MHWPETGIHNLWPTMVHGLIEYKPSTLLFHITQQLDNPQYVTTSIHNKWLWQGMVAVKINYLSHITYFSVSWSLEGFVLLWKTEVISRLSFVQLFPGCFIHIQQWTITGSGLHYGVNHCCMISILLLWENLWSLMCQLMIITLCHFNSFI